MLFSILQSGSLVDILVELILIMPVILFALSLHETAHGYAAYKCGDMTAYHMGRLTLNPLRHLDPLGFFCMLLFGFGWAKPVPINTRNFTNPKRGMAISAAAGPLANLILGVISSVFAGVFLAWNGYLNFVSDNQFVNICAYLLATLCINSAYLNFVFAIFNLIPIPPFDGSRLAFAFLPPKAYFGMMKYERQIMFGILIALFACSWLFDFSPVGWLAKSLSGKITMPIANGLWGLISKHLLLH